MTNELLNHPDERVRLRAIHAIAGEDSPQWLAQVVCALGDKSWRVRQEAVAELVRRGGAEVVGAVLRRIRDEHLNLSVLNSAIQVLIQGGADTTTSLLEFLTDPDAQLRTCAALTLGSLNDLRAIPALLRVLNDSDANVRYHAIEALGRLRAGAAADALAAVAESRDFSLAFVALDALANIGDTRAAYRLIPLLADELLQTAALETLGRLGDEEAVAPVAELLNSSSVSAITAARALVALYDRQETLYHNGASVMVSAQKAITPRGVQNLLSALEKSDGADLEGLAQILGWLESPGLDQALTQLLGHPSARMMTVDALVRRGPRVTEWLLALLSAADRDTRRAAVLTLGRLGTALAVPALLAALSGDEEIAVDVAGALAMIGDRRAYAPLLDLLGHADVGVRRAVVSALNSLGHPDMAKDMAAFLRDPRPLVRESAVKIVGYVGYSECVGLLLECCQDEKENVRCAAVESLPCLESVPVLPALGRALEDKAVAVRIAAARALGEVNDKSTLALLRGALDDSAPWVRYHAARSVGKQQDAGALDALIRLAQTDEAMQVRVAAVEALGRIGGAVALPVLISLADTPDRDLARVALTALAASAYPEAWPPLLSALHSPDRTRRLDAMKALGDGGRAEAVGEFQQIAASLDDELATAAVEALGHSSAPEAVDVLIELAVLPARRDACVVALVRCGANRTGRLARGLGHEHLDVRRAVVEALARIKNPNALEALKAALEDVEGAVRLAAFTALAHRGDSLEIQRLAALAGTDPDPAVRWAAKSTLRR